MKRSTFQKARDALLIDPYSGQPINGFAIVQGGIRLFQALAFLLLLIVLALGLTP